MKHRGIERHLGLTSFNKINLGYWTFAIAIMFLGSLSFSGFSSDSISLTKLIIWPVAPWLSFLTLGYVAARSLIFFSKYQNREKYLFLFLVGALLATGFIYFTKIIAILLVRLFTINKVQWHDLQLSNTEFALQVITVFLLFNSFYLSLEFLRRYRRLNELNKKATSLADELDFAQLNNLKMQMRPHFLFNALNTIIMMVRQSRTTDAVNMISNLSEMLRVSLGTSDKEFNLLKEEVRLIENLLAIENYRFEDRLTTEVNLSPDAAECLIPTLILQPIVENAFKHGVSKTVGEANVTVNCFIEDSSLILKVFNTGPSLPDDWELQKFQNIGLANTSSRLARIYGAASKLIIEELNNGILVTIKLPVQQ